MSDEPSKFRGSGLSAGARTRSGILDHAVDVASAEGLEGLTIGRLAKDLSMSKSGLFGHFGSKEELQLATIETARDVFIAKIIQPTIEVEAGLVRLKAMMSHWVAYVESRVFRGGCFFAAASAEFDGRPGPVRDQIAMLTKAWVDALEEETREAQRRDELPTELEPRQLVFELHAYVQEANWAHQLLDDPQAFDLARRAIDGRLDRAAS
ncbi:TetR/AcrR family transcriptional regulator [Haloferula sp.]|uniref:TetR/AcrR family transcriptional regulator n=1 Tax=Haloferula sp. TaxID=2497595 RepID=UPI0032A0B743